MGGQKTNSCPSSQQHSWHPFLFQVFLVYLRKVKGKPFNPFPQQLSVALSVLPGSCRSQGCTAVTKWELAGDGLPEPQPRLCPSGQATLSRALPLRCLGLHSTAAAWRTQNALSGNSAFHCSCWLLRDSSQRIIKKDSRGSHTCYTKKLQRLAPGHKVHLKGNCSTGDGTDYCLHMVSVAQDVQTVLEVRKSHICSLYPATNKRCLSVLTHIDNSICLEPRVNLNSTSM